VYKESVYRAVFKLDPATPEEAVKATADAFLRDEVGMYNLDDLYDYSMADTVKTRGTAILEIEDRVRARLERALGDWGLKLLGVDISTVEMPDDVKAKILEWWVTAWQKESMVAQAEGERRVLVEWGEGQAEALRAVETEKDLARRRLARQLMSIVRAAAGAGVHLDGRVAVRLVSVLEAVSTRMTSDSPTALKYLDALEKLLQSEGDKTIIVGESPPLLIKGEGQTEG
jgi:regulator of protease activity HflC (stomatin/prohibitin superfamily)